MNFTPWSTRSTIDRRHAVRAPYLVLALTAAAVGCGDDDDAPAGDAGLDGGEAGSSGRGGSVIRGRDAQVTAEDPVPQCDPTDPVPCGAGQKCHPVVRRAAGDVTYMLYTGCVEDRGGRAFGAPCEQWNGGAVPYRADGLEDELYVDPCDEGLYCAPSLEVRGTYTCQRACGATGCPSSDQQCIGDNAIEAVCRDIDRCDPLTGGGCATGMTCYLELDASGTRALPSCQATPPMPIGDGEACQFVGDCLPGSSCWGPPRLPPTRWTVETLLCRPSCSTLAASGGELDAGPEEDGGVGGVCPGGGMCLAGSTSGLDISLLPMGFGQCE